MSEQNKAIVRRIVEDYWNKKDPNLAGELFAANCTLKTPDGELNGLEGAAMLLTAYQTGFPDFRVTIEDMIAEGDRVVIRYGFAGTHKGQLGAFPASGNRVSTSGVTIFRIAGGKAADARFEWDRVGLRQQIGALPRD
jgi:steroid delta-isomerase-like uncharacterized protein